MDVNIYVNIDANIDVDIDVDIDINIDVNIDVDIDVNIDVNGNNYIFTLEGLQKSLVHRSSNFVTCGLHFGGFSGPNVGIKWHRRVTWGV